MDIKIGADPELFVKKGGVLVSGHNLVKGTKKRPFKVVDGAVQVDGIALEFNIDPASSKGQFLHNVESVMKQLAGMVPGYEFSTSCVAELDPAFQKSLPKSVLRLGCDPDYNAWTRMPNPTPDVRKPIRTAAGHVHIGWTNKQDVTDGRHFHQCVDVIRQMDIFLGLPSVIWDQENKIRMNLYGKAGTFRPKSYGAEYRVLSNKWIFNKSITSWVYDRVIEGMSTLGKGFIDKIGKEARKTIDSMDALSAEKLLKSQGIYSLPGV